MLATALTNECGGMCNKDATAELETTFCNKIRASGSAYLKSASHCNIQFEQQDNKKSSSMMLKKSHAPVVSESLATIDTTLILKGVNGAATSKEELAVIAKAYVSAYNDVHWDAGHYMADAEIPFVAGTPLEWSCTRCPDDDSARTGANTLVLDLVTPVIQWSCTRCPDDDAAEYVADLESNELTKKAVEVAFCNKLQASISDKLRATQLCSIAMETIVTSNNMGKVSA
jgi:methyl coenzyme M reductase subunit C